MATAAPRMQPEHQRRIRAFTLTSISTVLAIVVGVLIYALVSGFPTSGTGSIQAVAPGDNDRDLVVRATVGSPGCGDPDEVTVAETRDEVSLVVETTIPDGTRLDFNCDDQAATVYLTVRLDSPLGDRVVVDASNPDNDVEVLPAPADLIESDES